MRQLTLTEIDKKVEFGVNANEMLKCTQNMLLCGVEIDSRTKLHMSYLGVNERESFLKSFSILSNLLT